MMMLILGVGAAILPFLPFVLKLVRFGGLVFRLKREKIAHEAVGEPFPVQYDHAIEQHTETVKRTGYKLLLVGTSVFALFCGAQWWVNNDLREQHLIQMKEKERMRALAVNERDKYYTDYVNGQNEMIALKARMSEASIKRQGLIAIETKQKGEIRRKKIEAERKMALTEPVNPADILRIESTGDRETTGAEAIPDAPGLQAGGSDGTGS